jgi:hypothetical protein
MNIMNIVIIITVKIIIEENSVLEALLGIRLGKY